MGNWRVIRNVEQVASMGRKLSPDRKARLEIDLVGEGAVVVMPTAESPDGTASWWTVDSMGNTLGKSEEGWGAEVVEWTGLQAMVLAIGGVQAGMLAYLGWQACSKGGGGFVCFGCVVAGVLLATAAVVAAPLAAGAGPLAAVCGVATS